VGGDVKTDSDYEEKLKSFITEHAIDAEHLVFSQSCHSVAEAATAAGVTARDFVKNICMLDGTGRLIVGIIKGEDRVSTSRVARLLNTEEVRTATPEEILEKTGYPCGGTPSFGYNALYLVDQKVFEMEQVFTGGGSERSLVRIRPAEILRGNRAEVVRIRK
jgi:Cys-tRNA(Pro)/Cys-tRNA(Cys) deacylase